MCSREYGATPVHVPFLSSFLWLVCNNNNNNQIFVQEMYLIQWVTFDSLNSWNIEKFLQEAPAEYVIHKKVFREQKNKIKGTCYPVCFIKYEN